MVAAANSGRSERIANQRELWSYTEISERFSQRRSYDFKVNSDARITRSLAICAKIAKDAAPHIKESQTDINLKPKGALPVPRNGWTGSIKVMPSTFSPICSREVFVLTSPLIEPVRKTFRLSLSQRPFGRRKYNLTANHSGISIPPAMKDAISSFLHSLSTAPLTPLFAVVLQV